MAIKYISVFDGDLNHEGTEWPDWQNRSFTGTEEELREAIHADALECGEYADGDRLTVIVRSEPDGMIDKQFVIRVDNPGFVRDED